MKTTKYLQKIYIENGYNGKTLNAQIEITKKQYNQLMADFIRNREAFDEDAHNYRDLTNSNGETVARVTEYAYTYGTTEISIERIDCLEGYHF